MLVGYLCCTVCFLGDWHTQHPLQSGALSGDTVVNAVWMTQGEHRVGVILFGHGLSRGVCWGGGIVPTWREHTCKTPIRGGKTGLANR